MFQEACEQERLGRLQNGEDSVLPEGSETVWRRCLYKVLKAVHQMLSLKMIGGHYLLQSKLCGQGKGA